MEEPFKATQTAIEARNAQGFGEGYARITAGCNACHSALDHPFVVIKVPSEAAFPNQDFKPAK